MNIVDRWDEQFNYIDHPLHVSLDVQTGNLLYLMLFNLFVRES